MFAKPFPQINYSDIENLVDQRLAEGTNLDYKIELGNPDKAKKELAKDVSAFANSGGGYLILGISNDFKITGIESTVNNRPVIEWINQILSSNIVPIVKYPDPQVVKIPKSEKVIVVIHVPESLNKPHMTSESNSYFFRVNDISKPATHYQIRDMFEFSRNRSNDLKLFLEKRNISDENSKDFGKNKKSELLYNRDFHEDHIFKPTILYSLIPKNINGDKIQMPFEDLKDWLAKNSKGHEPFSERNLFYTHDIEPKLDGLVFKSNSNNYLKSYFEILNNGYVEAGLSESFFGQYEKNATEKIKYAHLTGILGYELMFLNFSKKYFEFINYSDEVILRLSFINVRWLKLEGLYTESSWVTSHQGINLNDANFMLDYPFLSQNLTEDNINTIVKGHSEKICRAFGLEKNYGYKNDEINFKEFRGIYSL